MSSGDTDSVELYRGYFDEFCEQITRLYEGPSDLFANNMSSTLVELLLIKPVINAIASFKKIPARFFSESLSLPVNCDDLITRVCRRKYGTLEQYGDGEIDFMWLLFLTGKDAQLNRVHSASYLHRDQLLVFVDGKGNIYPGGVYYQNLERYRGRSVLDGDADILVGVAKKRGFSRNELERGRPFAVGGQLLRNDKRFKWSWYSQL